MTRGYAALLRGVNVNGVSVKMADLAAAFRELGFEGVRTVLASGNVLLEAENSTDLKERIETALSRTFGYQARVVVLDLGTLRQVVDGYPFERERLGRHAYAVFSSDAELLKELLAVRGELDPQVERVEGGDGMLYWEVVRGKTTESPFGKLLGKARFRETTTRNLNTLDKLLA